MLVVVDFNSIDANTGKSGNGANDIGAANAIIVSGIAGFADAGLGETCRIDQRRLGVTVIFCECVDGA